MSGSYYINIILLSSRLPESNHHAATRYYSLGLDCLFYITYVLVGFLDLCQYVPHGGSLQTYRSTIRTPYTSAIYLITSGPLYGTLEIVSYRGLQHEWKSFNYYDSDDRTMYQDVGDASSSKARCSFFFFICPREQFFGVFHRLSGRGNWTT